MNDRVNHQTFKEAIEPYLTAAWLQKQYDTTEVPSFGLLAHELLEQIESVHISKLNEAEPMSSLKLAYLKQLMESRQRGNHECSKFRKL